jgi:hypothetical protein
MSVLPQNIIGQVEKLANSPVLGTGALRLVGSSPTLPTNEKVVELVKEKTTLTRLRDLLRLMQQVATSAKGVLVVADYLRHSSLRNYRHLLDTFSSANKYCYLTPFFKFLMFAVVQVVSQHTQQNQRNIAVVQSNQGECSRYVYK